MADEKPKRKRCSETTMYVVLASGEASGLWTYAGEVTVPAGTKQRTVIAKAVKELSLEVGSDGRILWLIPGAVESVAVKVEQPEPRLVIG